MPDDQQPLLARNLRIARTRKGLSQKQAAKALGLTEVTVSNHERGATTPSVDLVNRYAEEYEVPASLLRHAEDLEGELANPSDPQADLKGLASRVLRSHAVRVWIADFRSELTKAHADDEEIERAVQLVQRPEVLTFYSRGKVRALSEEDAITALEAIAVPIRAELKRRGRKFS